MSRLFTDILRDINAGKFNEELSDALAEIVAACTATGKTGELTVKLKLKPAKGSQTVMTIEQDYKVKAPEFDQPQQFFFVTGGNTLVSDNPEQRKIEFKEVIDRNTGEIKTVERVSAKTVTPTAATA